MENREPAGRPGKRYERSDTGNKRSSRPGGKSVSKTGKPAPKEIEKEIELIRLNRFIANSGVCSRRDAD